MRTRIFAALGKISDTEMPSLRLLATTRRVEFGEPLHTEVNDVHMVTRRNDGLIGAKTLRTDFNYALSPDTRVELESKPRRDGLRYGRLLLGGYLGYGFYGRSGACFVPYSS